ncbi:hypothetical protein [Tepidimicrobium xylanilyticum]|nr:hypothetical protein [Tepidimicrobium xylanilyticum]
MFIMLISALFLLYLSNIEYFIVNSSLNSIQAFYLSEGKINMVLKDEKYYKEQLLPRIETFIRLGRITPIYDRNILIDSEDLFKGDSNKIVTVNFKKEDRMIMELETYSVCNNVKQDISAKLTIINDFFEMRNPVLSIDRIPQDRIEEFENYLAYLEENIIFEESPSGIIILEAMDYNRVEINQLMDGRTSIMYFRNGMEKPIKEEILISNEMILIIRDGYVTPTLTIESERELDEVILKGILYIEGDLEINCNFDFSGILILNRGSIYVNTLNEVNVDGVVLLKDLSTIPFEKNGINANYDFDIIRKYGIYLPKFVDPKIEIIKN